MPLPVFFIAGKPKKTGQNTTIVFIPISEFFSSWKKTEDQMENTTTNVAIPLSDFYHQGEKQKKTERNTTSNIPRGRSHLRIL